MSPIFGSRTSLDAAYLFSVGSGQVHGALVLFELHKKPTVVYSTKESFLSGMTDPKAIIISLDRALEKVARLVTTDGVRALARERRSIRKISNIYCTFEAPWFEAETRILHIKEKNPITITPPFLHKLSQYAVKKYLEETATETSATAAEETTLLESEVIDVLLNGYRTDEPLKKKADTVDTAVYVSTVLKDVRASSDRIFKKFAPHIPITYHSSPLVNYATLRDHLHGEHDFLEITIGEELTQVSLIQEGVLIETATFPRGKNFFLKTLSTKTGTAPEELLSMLSLYAKKAAEQRQHDRFETALEETEKLWNGDFHAVLEHFSKKLALPKNIYVTTDEELGDFFKTCIAEEEYGQYHLASGTFEITLVTTLFKDAAQFTYPTKRDGRMLLIILFAYNHYTRFNS